MGIMDKILKKGKTSTIDSEQLNVAEESQSTEEEIHPTVSYHPSWNLTQEEQYVYNFSNFELPPLKPNQISISGIDYDYEDDMLTVIAFVRHSIDKTITLGETVLNFVNSEGRVIARQTFDLSELGELPPCSSRPYRFIFDENNILAAPSDNETEWQMAFEIKKDIPHELILHPTWEERIPEEGKKQLRDIFARLGAPKYGEVNFVGFQASTQENGNFAVSLMIRNGNDQDISIEQLPLEVIDAEGNIVAKGGFKLEDFTIRAQSTMPWSFIFPKELVLIENPNLERWAVRVIQ